MFLQKSSCIRSIVISFVTLFGLSPVTALQADEQVDSIPCLTLSRIQNIDILDNKHIVFQTRVNDYYLNTLPYTCHGLSLNDRFMYRTSLNQLCDVDTITVIGSIDADFYTGPSCGLGRFVAVNKDEIRALREELKVQ